MARAQFTPLYAGTVRIDGDLTVDSVPQLYDAGRRLIGQSDGGLQIDLAGVERADSGGLALMVDWLALATAQGRTLKYLNLPESILALAGLSEVAQLLMEPG